MPIPKYDELMEPLLLQMKALGGSASIEELEDAVANALRLSEDDLAEILSNGKQTRFGYRLAWARTYLKKFGYLDNSARGVWVLTPEGQKATAVDSKKIKRYVKSLTKKKNDSDVDSPEENIQQDSWEQDLLEILKTMPFDAFERLCQRLLRESGFIQVEVTGKSGDEGVDGKGVVRIGGLLSFHVIFQCKRYKGSVAPSYVRDFRGAMVGRADKGLLITTGTFTRDARKEAQRDGAPPIDLIDGEDLVQKLKELALGVNVKEKIVEEVTIDPNYFKDV